jgi:hypothetical protein
MKKLFIFSMLIGFVSLSKAQSWTVSGVAYPTVTNNSNGSLFIQRTVVLSVADEKGVPVSHLGTINFEASVRKCFGNDPCQEVSCAFGKGVNGQGFTELSPGLYMFIFNLPGGVEINANAFNELFIQVVQQRITLGGGKPIPPLVKTQIVLQ